ncbi:chorismate-binding protein [Thermodesulfovibrio hydrogeniphilus]
MLVLCGNWLGKEGFYEADIEYFRFYSSLDEIENIEPLSFAVFSYDLSGESLNLNIKKSKLPAVILLKIRNLRKIRQIKNSYTLKPLSSSMNDSDFIEGILKIKMLIEEGTVYQINLTNRFDFEFLGDSLSLFFNFYRSQPVPYAFYLRLDDFFLISGSMELFLERVGSIITSKPIKGTANTRKFLENSLKDKAENLMITDMMRNDIGRIAKIGSVTVPELFKITKYKTLYQMHSTVQAHTEKSLIEILKATFPPASVTGAPKRKAVQMIDTLESHPRSYYCGCAGLIKNETDFTLSVLIRTAVGYCSKLSYYAGCGIVWDSVPERELDELYLKMKAFYSRTNF